jgi:predicted alpha/beta hydrolase family esterase
LISYDYSGYGRSEGKVSEKEIYSDIDEVAKFAKDDLGILPCDLILFGHSLGSAPTVHLAAKNEYRNIKAIIFISPIASGVKLVSPELDFNKIDKMDVFSNLKKITDVHCPIFIIHGEKDQVVPISQSKEMSKFIKNPYEWFPKGGDHSNILTKYRTKFFQKCKFFLEYLNYYFSRKASNYLSPSHSFVDIRKEDFMHGSFNFNGNAVDEEYYGNGKHHFTYREKENFLDEGSPKNNLNSTKKLRHVGSIASDCPFDNNHCANNDDLFLSCVGSKAESVDGEQRLSKDSIVVKGKNFEDQYNRYFKSAEKKKFV